MAAQIEDFGALPDGRRVERIRLRGPRLRANLLTLGATLQDLRLDGVGRPLVLGFPSVEPYLGEGLYVGAAVGRFANRIGGARFALEGREFALDPNFRGRHTLHGGSEGVHAQLWTIGDLTEAEALLRLTLPEGHMGFPGLCRLEAQISVAGEALSFAFSAQTEAPTPISLAHHGYFDLDGEGDLRGHQLQIAAERYLPVNADLIPTGEIAPVAGGPFDFRALRPIGPFGYDQNFCLAEGPRPLSFAARLIGRSGLEMRVETTAPGLQLYDGAHFNGLKGLEGRIYGPCAGLALETQAWPDAPNQPHFPSALLRPGEIWTSRTRYLFAAEAQ